MRSKILATLVLLIAALIPSAAWPRTVHDDALEVTFSIPDAAQPIDTTALPNLNARYAYSIDHPDGSRIVIAIGALGGTIGREHLEPSDFAAQFPPGAIVTRESGRWQQFDVDIFHANFTMQGQSIAARIVQIPIRRQAVQIVVEGTAQSDAEIDALMHAVLGSVQGQSNWLTPFERGERLGRGLGALAVTVVLVALGIRAMRKRRNVRTG